MYDVGHNKVVAFRYRRDDHIVHWLVRTIHREYIYSHMYLLNYLSAQIPYSSIPEQARPPAPHTFDHVHQGRYRRRPRWHCQCSSFHQHSRMPFALSRNYISSTDNYYFRLLSLNASQPLFHGVVALPLLTILPSFLVAKFLPLLWVYKSQVGAYI